MHGKDTDVRTNDPELHVRGTILLDSFRSLTGAAINNSIRNEVMATQNKSRLQCLISSTFPKVGNHVTDNGLTRLTR